MISTMNSLPSVERTGVAVVRLPGDVEAYVSNRLAELGRAIMRDKPRVTTRTVASHGGTLYLNCYAEFSSPGLEDDLVATVTYRNNLGRFVVGAVVCWGETGREVWARPEVDVNPNDPDQVGRELRAAADELATRAGAVGGELP